MTYSFLFVLYAAVRPVAEELNVEITIMHGHMLDSQLWIFSRHVEDLCKTSFREALDVTGSYK